jgi:TRAP-type mannitol/chloroaromatic compound transport system permease small subunit/TM2 domain-containing membrane protein YozV
MPHITFVLPHWLYWGGLLFVPLMAMYIVRKQRGKTVDGVLSKPVAYLLWLCGGFAGLHRFYVRNMWGLVYIPIFIALLLFNVQVRSAVDAVSGVKNEVNIAEFDEERAQKDIDKGRDGAQQKMDKAKQAMAAAQQNLADAEARHAKWVRYTTIAAIIIAVFLLIDAFLLPGMVKKCAAREAPDEAALAAAAAKRAEFEKLGKADATIEVEIKNPFFHWIDKINGYVGEYVSFWSIIAVFVYYYEVLARYLFNSPTNWAHESMFLMFGMQYVLAAGFTHRENAHVHVDVLYQYFPVRAKAAINVFTSIFFFIFCIVLFWTGWRFAADSIGVWEVSFTEWAIQYWPVKVTMSVGAILLMLDGITKLTKDLIVLFGKRV